MGHLYDTVISAIYRQRRKGQSPPVRLVLNPMQMRQFLAEHAAGCRAMGVNVRVIDVILGVDLAVDSTAAGSLVTEAGTDVPLIAH